MINTTNLNQARKEILALSKENKKPIIVKAQNLEFNRKILEYGKFHVLLSPELSADAHKVKLKQPNSGLNHVMARIAAKNKIRIGIDLEKLRTLDPKEKAQALSKIKENIKFCRKAKCPISVLNHKNKKDASDFLLSLGASSQQIIEAFKLL